MSERTAKAIGFALGSIGVVEALAIAALGFAVHSWSGLILVQALALIALARGISGALRRLKYAGIGLVLVSLDVAIGAAIYDRSGHAVALCVVTLIGSMLLSAWAFLAIWMCADVLPRMRGASESIVR
jgi:hypothetical protein